MPTSTDEDRAELAALKYNNGALASQPAAAARRAAAVAYRLERKAILSAAEALLAAHRERIQPRGAKRGFG